MPHIGVCLGCLVRPTSTRTSIYWTWIVQRRAARYVTNNYTDWQVTGQCKVTSMVGKSEVVKPWTTRTTDLPGDALDKINNGGLVDINPANFFLHSDPRRTRGAPQKTAPGLAEQTQQPVSLGLSVLLVPLYRLWLEPRVLPTAVSLVPSFESFDSRLGRSLHNLKPVPTSPWIPRPVISQ